MLYLNRKCDCVPRCSHATLPPRFCRIPLRDVDNFILHSRRRRTDHKPLSIAIDQSQLASFFRFPQPSRSSPPLSLPLFLFSSRFCNGRNNLPCVLNDYLYAHRFHFLLSEGGFPIQPNFCLFPAVQTTSIDPILVLDTTLSHGITLSRLHRK